MSHKKEVNVIVPSLQSVKIIFTKTTLPLASNGMIQLCNNGYCKVTAKLRSNRQERLIELVILINTTTNLTKENAYNNITSYQDDL